jgi:hypothetical protein
MTGVKHPFVIVQFGVRELAWFRFNPRPLNAKPVSVEAELGGERDVLPIAMVAVASVARRLLENGRPDLFAEPKVGVCVVSFDLVGGSRSSPQEGYAVLWGSLRSRGRTPLARRRCRHRQTEAARDHRPPGHRGSTFVVFFHVYSPILLVVCTAVRVRHREKPTGNP